MPQKTGGPLAHVQPHPPFPSFSWVMAAQANPPSPAFAYGYVRNARAQSGMHTRPPARRTVPPELHQQPRHPHSAKPPQPPPPQRATRAKGGAVAAEHDESFMESVDYRFHDPPSRPYVPWLEGYTMRGRGAQRQVTGTGPDTTATTEFSERRLAGSAGGSDDARSKKKKRTRTRTRTTVDVVNNNRLDSSDGEVFEQVVLSALRRACGLSAIDASHSHDRR